MRWPNNVSYSFGSHYFPSHTISNQKGEANKMTETKSIKSNVFNGLVCLNQD